MTNLYSDISRLKNPPAEHEFWVAKVFSKLGRDVIFIPRSNIENNKQPDFEIGGVRWELKSPIGDSRRTFQNNIQKAQLQSKNIIISLHRSKADEAKAISRIDLGKK